MRTSGRIFLGLGVWFVLVTAVYWLTSYEDAGTAMLLVAAGFGVLAGGYLFVVARRAEVLTTDERPEVDALTLVDDTTYLPHASVWPFVVGAGSLVVVNGLALGLWALVPGLILTSFGLYGYARQSRHRD